MNPVLARLLTRLYPRSWRERYGEEFEAHLETGPGNLATLANVVWGALSERVFQLEEGSSLFWPLAISSGSPAPLFPWLCRS